MRLPVQPLVLVLPAAALVVGLVVLARLLAQLLPVALLVSAVLLALRLALVHGAAHGLADLPVHRPRAVTADAAPPPLARGTDGDRPAELADGDLEERVAAPRPLP